VVLGVLQQVGQEMKVLVNIECVIHQDLKVFFLQVVLVVVLMGLVQLVMVVMVLMDVVEVAVVQV
jgi:hypothetical protein